MTPERLGTVNLELGSRTVPLRFTWAAIDGLGRNGVAAVFTKAQSGEPGDMDALASLIALASGGAITHAELMADPPSIAEGLAVALKAWMVAVQGPTPPAEDRHAPDPRMRRPTWWRRLFRLRSPAG